MVTLNQTYQNVQDGVQAVPGGNWNLSLQGPDLQLLILLLDLLPVSLASAPDASLAL